MLWTSEPRLVDADISKQVEPAPAHIGDLKDHIFAHGVLHTCVVLVEIRRAEVAVIGQSRQVDGFYKPRELIRRWRRKERIRKRRFISVSSRSSANDVVRWQLNRG